MTVASSLLPQDREEARHLRRVFVRVLVISMPILTLMFGLLEGVKEGRPKLQVWHADIVGSHHVPAGNDIRLRTVAEVPAGCIPKLTFWIEFPPDKLSVDPPTQAQKVSWLGRFMRHVLGIKPPILPRKVINQSVTDTNIPFNGGDNLIFTTIHFHQGHGHMYGLLTTQGCGAASGILAPDSKTFGPIDVWIDPPLPVFAETLTGGSGPVQTR